MGFTPLDLSILGEIGNQSVGGAASTLSNFVEKIVTISIPDTKTITFKELKTMVEPSVVFVKVDYNEEIDGTNVLMMKEEEAFAFSRFIAQDKLNHTITEWDDYAKSVLKEVFNIMVGNMVATVAELFKKDVKMTIPVLFEKDAEELDFYKDEDELVAIWFDVKIESEFKVRLVKIMEKEQADAMVTIIKGEYDAE